MARLTSLLLIVLMAMTAACSQSGQSLPDTLENRTTLAKRYLEAMPPKEVLHGLGNRIEPTLPEANRKLFREVMGSAEIEKATYRIMLDALVQNFTLPELEAMVAFYGSPAGHSAWKKFLLFMNETIPQIQQEVRKAMTAAQKPAETQEPPRPKSEAAPPAPPASKELKAPPGNK